MRRRFQRARAPEEKEVRRQAILTAARRLMAETGAAAFSLSELARRSRVSKPNIYRYFENREEVLLHVWIEEVRALADDVAAAFAAAPVGSHPATIEAIVAAFSARPQLCELMAMVSPVLERTLSVDAIVTAKQTLTGLTMHIAQLLHDRLPAIALEDCAWAASTIGIYIAGIWPAIHPGPAAAEALRRPELAGFALELRRDFTRFLQVLFAGLR